MLPHLDPAAADALRVALRRTGYTPDGVRELLGPAAHAALGRGEPEPALRASRDAAELGVLVRLLLLGAVEPDRRGGRGAGPARPGRRPRRPGCCAATATAGPPRWTCGRTASPGADWWVLSDLDARRQQRDHVTGVGAASVTLAAATAAPTGGHAARPGHRVRGAGVARRPARRRG